MNLLINILFSYLASVGFGVLLNIPRRALNGCGIIEVLGWMVYLFIKHLDLGNMLANLLAAFAIGVTAIIFARVKKMPMILFNIPSLVPLVPGGQSYRAIRYFALGNNSLAIEYLVQVGMIAGAIAMGFFLAELVGQVYFKIRTVKES